MPDLHEQLRNWSQALADSVPPTDIDRTTSLATTSEKAHPNRRWLAVAASVAVVVVGIVGVATLSGNGADQISPVTEPPATTNTTPTSTNDPTDADADAFCVEFAALGGEQPESYVGSQEHVADINALLAAAPAPVRADLIIFRDYLSSGAVDSQADPESTSADNWPAEVQSAIASTQNFAADNC